MRLERIVELYDEELLFSYVNVPCSPRWYGKEWDLVLKLAIEYPEWEVDYMTDYQGNVVWDEYEVDFNEFGPEEEEDDYGTF